MNTYKIDLTVGPSVSLAKMSTAPFVEEHALSGGYSYLAIDVNLKHVEIETQAEKPTRKTDLDELRGVVKIHLPMKLSGYHFNEVLLSDRGLRALSYLAYQADKTGDEVTVVSPRQYIDALHFLSARFADAAAEELVAIPAEAIHLKEWRLKIIPAEGKTLRKFEMLQKVGAIDEMYDLETEKVIKTRTDLDEAIEARARKAAVEGLHIEGLGKHFELLYQRCVLNMDVSIPGMPEAYVSRETAKHASRSVAVSMRSILTGTLMIKSHAKKIVAVSLEESSGTYSMAVDSTDKYVTSVAATDTTYSHYTNVMAQRLLSKVTKLGLRSRSLNLRHLIGAGSQCQANGETIQCKAQYAGEGLSSGSGLTAAVPICNAWPKAVRAGPRFTTSKHASHCFNDLGEQIQAEFGFNSNSFAEPACEMDQGRLKASSMPYTLNEGSSRNVGAPDWQTRPSRRERCIYREGIDAPGHSFSEYIRNSPTPGEGQTMGRV